MKKQLYLYCILFVCFAFTINAKAQNNALNINTSVDITGLSYPNEFTLEFMLQLDSLNTSVLPNFFIDNNGGFTLSFSGNNCIVVQPVFTTNKWYRISISKDTILKVYIDGVLTIQSSNVTLGATDNLQFFNGFIDDIRLWNTALTESNIQNNLYQHLTGSETGLLLYIDFDSGITDLTGNYTISSTGNNTVPSTAFANYTNGTWYGVDTAENICFSGNNVISFNVNCNNVVTRNSFTTTFNKPYTLQVNNNYFGDFHFKEGAGFIQNNINTVNTKKITTEATGQYSEFRYDYWVSPGAQNMILDYGVPTASENQNIIVPTQTKTLSTINDLFPIGNNTGEHNSGWIYSSHGGIPYGEAFVANWSVNPTNRGLLPMLGFTLKGQIGSNPANSLKTFQTIPENGAISIDFSHIPNEDVLIGNPYPSMISLSDFILHNQNSIRGCIDYWLHWGGNDHVTSNYLAGYAIQNLLGIALPHDTFTYNGESLFANDNIIPNKSFFTWTLPGVTNIEFNNSMRIPSNTIEDHSNKNRCWLSLKKEGGNDQQKDQFLFGATSSTTNNYDYGYDAIHVHDHRPTLIYSFLGTDTTTRYKIQSVDDSFTDDIKLGVKVNQTGNHIFNIELEENMTNADYIYLIDNETNSYYNLRTGPATVAFSTTGFIDNRFLLRFNNAFLNTYEYELADNILIWQDNSKIHIEIPEQYEDYKIFLYSIDGRKIIETSTNSIDKVSLSIGTYIAKIQVKNQQILTNKKIVIN